MADIELNAIEQRADWFRENDTLSKTNPGSVSAYGLAAAAIKSAEDVPALLEYVDKLVRRATLAEARLQVTSRELEEERRHCAALREQVRVLEESDDGQVVILTAERDRLRNELGEVCEERDALRRGVRAIGQTVLRGQRRIAVEEGGGSNG